MKEDLKSKAHGLLLDLDLAGLDDELTVSPLSGGIASDIAVVAVNDRKLCIKFALHKMRVKEDWFAPVKRNRTEYLWLEFARTIAPENTPGLHGHSETMGGFVMEYLESDDTCMWKSLLLEGQPDAMIAGRTGDFLGRVHAASASPGFERERFDTKDVFFHMRIEPYILFTAGRHPPLATRLNAIAQGLAECSIALVHGDVSPKNIMLHMERVILVDAECASMGDPSFDVAFFLNHMFLKAIHNHRYRQEFLQSALRFWLSYARHVSWEAIDDIASRTARLLPALALARVDGKSPVEYLNGNSQDLVREITIPLIANPCEGLPDLLVHMFSQLETDG